MASPRGGGVVAPSADGLASPSTAPRPPQSSPAPLPRPACQRQPKRLAWPDHRTPSQRQVPLERARAAPELALAHALVLVLVLAPVLALARAAGMLEPAPLRRLRPLSLSTERAPRPGRRYPLQARG